MQGGGTDGHNRDLKSMTLLVSLISISKAGMNQTHCDRDQAERLKRTNRVGTMMIGFTNINYA